MKFSEAFRETLFRFNIKGKDVAEKSGVSAGQISRFRNGRLNITTGALERLLESIPPEAKAYMLSLVAKGEFNSLQ